MTPINDSFVDFAMLAKVEPEYHAVVHPSIYGEIVWEARKRSSARDRGRVDWIVVRNRLGAATCGCDRALRPLPDGWCCRSRFRGAIWRRRFPVADVAQR